MYHKRIVVDFDDTLAFHQNRKFDEALPNKPLIEKLNKLHAEDWIIDIFTARGSIFVKLETMPVLNTKKACLIGLIKIM